jgi:UDP-glucose 4-epimerase
MQARSVLPRFVRQALTSENIAWYGSGERTQDFVHVTDVVGACLLAAASSTPGIYNIGSGVPISMKQLAHLILRMVPHSRSQVLPADLPDPEEGCRWEVDVGKARNNLGYSPKVRLEDGLRQYIDFVHSGARSCRWWN